MFVDEAVFTCNQIRPTVWAAAGGTGVTMPKNALGFQAVAVVAAITAEGEVIAIKLAEKSINTSDFITFLQFVDIRLNRGKAYMFLDNLKMHHSRLVAQ